MAPPKRAPGGSQRKGGQALISRFFGSQACATPPSTATPARARASPANSKPPEPTTKSSPAAAAAAKSLSSPCAPAAPSAAAGDTALATPGSTPQAQRASDGVGKRVLPSKRRRVTKGAALTVDAVDDGGDDGGDVVERDGEGEGGDGDFCLDLAARAPAEGEGEDADGIGPDVAQEPVVKTKRRRTVVIDSDEEDRDELADAAAEEVEEADADEDEDADGDGDEERGAPAPAGEIMAVFAASGTSAAPRDERRRRQFEKSIGRLDKNSWFMRTTGGGGGGGGDDSGKAGAGGSGEGGQYVVGSGGGGKNGPKLKYTPLEQQFVDIKKKNPDKLLLVECGYKFQFFGEDAVIASKVCRIFCSFKQNFDVASVPNVALARHVSRLVAAGHKVGIVRQIDTAALKRASDKKSGTFRRELCEVYTRGTLFADGALGDESGSGSSASYIAAFAETTAAAVGPDGGAKAQLAFVAVDTATGDVVFDSFADDVMRSELDSRLMAVEPVEVVVSKSEMSAASERAFAHYCFVANARLDRVLDETFHADGALAAAGADKNQGLRQLVADACSSADGTIAPQHVLGCAQALAVYLKQFKLERAMRGAHEFRSFSARREMQLGSDVLRNFEIFHNSNDGRRAGSLLSLINRTKTPFGSRQMKRWLAHPLTSAPAIRDRLGAVESLRQLVDGAFSAGGGTAGALTPDACLVELLDSLSKSFPDLERGLARISYEKCAPSLFIGIVDAFRRAADSVQAMKRAMQAAAPKDRDASIALKSPLLARMIESVPDISLTLDRYVFQRLHVDAARRNDHRGVLRDAQPDACDGGDGSRDGEERELAARTEQLAACCEKVRQCEDGLDDLLVQLRREHKHPGWEWKKVAQDEYLLEVPAKGAKSMPRDWEIVSTTKAQKRYRPRRAAELLELLEQSRELCDEAAGLAWRSFLTLFSTTTAELRAVVRFLCDLDCLASHARTSLLPGYVKPEILDPAANRAGVRAVDARHPIAESLLNVPYVPNDVSLGLPLTPKDASVERCMVITGPNMGGKSSYIRMAGLIVIMAQVGLFVPAASAQVSPVDAMFCRMGARDVIGQGMSTLMCELAETSKILELATDRSLIVLDELGRGTSTHDGTAIAAATLEHLVRASSAVVLFVTHFPSIARMAETHPGAVGSYFLDYLEESEAAAPVVAEVSAAKKKITFLYKVTPGVAKRSYGLNVARLAGLPEAVVHTAAEAASSFDKGSTSRGAEAVFHDLISGLGGSAGEGSDRPLAALRAVASTGGRQT